ncbi:tetratricopeptide repeat protein [Streptomyces aquilus]|uniref:Tetratricopeptide repeat protein n=1 Tax=Streptomyces aquilus TaxID=2548456 RepID=A0A3Q9BVR6_9ACTN|nr:tetratricopeptide repeat protein [Streptomyces aquilus]AZP15528.1 tetratricopeptide repeat protein [Streptomyces aquilus]
MGDGPAGNLHALASAYLIAGRPFDAVALLEFLADADPENLAFRGDLATTYVQIGNVERASRELQRILEITPRSAETEQQLTEVQAWLRWQESERDFQRRRAEFLRERIAGGDSGVDEYVMLGRALHVLARVPGSGVDWPDVVAVLTEARRLDGTHIQVLELLAASSHNAGAEADWHDALLALEQVDPQSSMLEQARSMLEVALPDPDMLLEVACSDSDDAHGALRELRSQYRVSPNNPDVQRCLMQAEAFVGIAAEALWIAEVMARGEDLGFAEHGALALVHGVVGDPQRMDHHAATALSLAPNAETRAEFQASYDMVRAK